MRHIFKYLFALALCWPVLFSCSPSSGRVTEDFNFEWRFQLGDSPDWSAPGFDDSSWRQLRLPHDWGIEGEFSPKHPAGTNGGALPGGIGWYRKHFRTPKAERVAVEFDGVYMNSTVWVNGVKVGERPYGYSSFNVDLTGKLNPVGEDNVIAVKVDHSKQPSGRWYTGSGIYRNVRLVCTDADRIAYSGVCVTTPEISDAEATVLIRTELDAATPMACSVFHRILDADGKTVAKGTDAEPLRIARPHRWDITDPYLYTVETELKAGGKVVDQVETRIGIRETEWDVDKGFFLNGRSVKLNGACQHHDLGCIGTAVHRRALQRQLEILQAAGFNAIRTSHNIPAPELLDLCDEMGLLVLDEAFDKWRGRKDGPGYGAFFDEWNTQDLTDWVKRDRNHPSVIIWSIGNEIGEQMARTPEERQDHEELSRHLADVVRANDPTRPVTCGCNGPDKDNCVYTSGALDVIGLNYRAYAYDSLRVWFPGKPILGTETVSAQNSRGIYFQPSTILRVPGWMPWSGTPEPTEEELKGLIPNQCSAYDNSRALWDCTTTHEGSWIPIRDRDWVAGGFIWTGFDYLGEPTAFRWPSRSSYFGIVDLAGFPKDPYYMYQSEWTDKTMLHLFPHWNWTEGEKVDVWAYYNNADEVELFLNGKSLGRTSKTRDQLHAIWPEVVFEPGKIEAVSYKDGQEVARAVRETTGPAVGLRLTADRNTIDADGYDLSFVTVEAVDAEGRALPQADARLTFRVEGAGELLGIDNGDAADTLCMKGAVKPLFSGKALAVIRSFRGEKGIASLKVSSELGDATIDIKTR